MLPARDVCALASTSRSSRIRCRREGAWRDRMLRVLARVGSPCDPGVPSDEDECLAIYSRLLHAHGSLLGFWRADAPPHGGLVHVRFEPGDGVGRIVGYLVSAECPHADVLRCSECATPLFYVEPDAEGGGSGRCRAVCCMDGRDEEPSEGARLNPRMFAEINASLRLPEGSIRPVAGDVDDPDREGASSAVGPDEAVFRHGRPTGTAHEAAIELRLRTCATSGDNVCEDAHFSCQNRCYRVSERTSLLWGGERNRFLQEVIRRGGDEVHRGGFPLLRLDVVEEVTRTLEEERHPLRGLYRGDYASHGQEFVWVDVRREAPDAWCLVGLKVTGDFNVPCSQITWKSRPFRHLPFPPLYEGDVSRREESIALLNQITRHGSPERGIALDALAHCEVEGAVHGRGQIAEFGYTYPEWMDHVNCVYFKGNPNVFALHWMQWNAVTLYHRVA